MRARGVVVREVTAQQAAEVSFVEHDDVIERAHVEHLVGSGVGLKVHTDESTEMLWLQLHEVMETAEGLQVLWDVTLGLEHHQRAATPGGNDAPSTRQ